MNYSVFKLLHLIGIMFLFAGIGGLYFASGKDSAQSNARIHRLAKGLHGIGWLLILVGGLLAGYYLGLFSSGAPPVWVILKLIILVCFGPITILARRPATRRFLLPTAFILGGAAGYLALFKPF